MDCCVLLVDDCVVHDLLLYLFRVDANMPPPNPLGDDNEQGTGRYGQSEVANEVVVQWIGHGVRFWRGIALQSPAASSGSCHLRSGV